MRGLTALGVTLFLLIGSAGSLQASTCRGVFSERAKIDGFVFYSFIEASRPEREPVAQRANAIIRSYFHSNLDRLTIAQATELIKSLRRGPQPRPDRQFFSAVTERYAQFDMVATLLEAKASELEDSPATKAAIIELVRSAEEQRILTERYNP